MLAVHIKYIVTLQIRQSFSVESEHAVQLLMHWNTVLQ